MVSTGQSDWLIHVGSTGEVVLLPVTAAAVVGGPDPRTWIYTLTMPGPSQSVTLQRSGGIHLELQAARGFTITLDRKARD